MPTARPARLILRKGTADHRARRGARAGRGYHEAQRRIVRDAVRLPISEVLGEWARNPKRVSTPFAPEYGEDSLHFSYNYPELLKLLN